MRPAWPNVQLGSLLERSEQTIRLEPDTTYKEVTVRMNGKGVIERRQVQGAEIVSDRRFAVRAGQFIISRIDARHGASGLIPIELDGAVVTNDFPVFDVKETSLYPKFLGWLSKTSSFVELCKHASEGTTNRVRLSEERFKALEISLPPLKEQRRIVARIEELAAKVREARTLRTASHDELSVLPLARLRVIFSALASVRIPLEDACSAIIDNLHTNPVYSDNGTVPCIRSSDVGYGSLDLVNARRTDEAEYQRRTIRGEPKVNDIVLVREGGGTGKCALVEKGHRFSLGQRVMMIRPDETQVRPRFFLYQLLSPTIQDDHITPLSKGSASPHLNIGALRCFPFAVPNLQVQDRIVAELDALHAKLDAVRVLHQETAGELDAMIPAVLNKAFNGELL